MGGGGGGYSLKHYVNIINSSNAVRFWTFFALHNYMYVLSPLL